jgi:hypothetical protein
MCTIKLTQTELFKSCSVSLLIGWLLIYYNTNTTHKIGQYCKEKKMLIAGGNRTPVACIEMVFIEINSNDFLLLKIT